MTIEITNWEHLRAPVGPPTPTATETPPTVPDTELVSDEQPLQAAPLEAAPLAEAASAQPSIETSTEIDDAPSISETAVNPHAQLEYVGRTPEGFNIFRDAKGQQLVDVPDDPPQPSVANSSAGVFEAPMLGEATDPQESGYLNLEWHRGRRFRIEGDGDGIDLYHHSSHALQGMRERLGLVPPTTYATPASGSEAIAIPVATQTANPPTAPAQTVSELPIPDQSFAPEVPAEPEATAGEDSEPITEPKPSLTATEVVRHVASRITVRGVGRAAVYGAGVFIMGKSFYAVTGGVPFFDFANHNHLVDAPFGVVEGIVQHVSGAIQGGINVVKFFGDKL